MGASWRPRLVCFTHSAPGQPGGAPARVRPRGGVRPRVQRHRLQRRRPGRAQPRRRPGDGALCAAAARRRALGARRTHEPSACGSWWCCCCRAGCAASRWWRSTWAWTGAPCTASSLPKAAASASSSRRCAASWRNATSEGTDRPCSTSAACSASPRRARSRAGTVPASATAHCGAAPPSLQQPVDRQAGQEADLEAQAPVGLRVHVVAGLGARGTALDPHQALALRRKAHLVGQIAARRGRTARASSPAPSGLSSTTPSSVFSRAERWSKLKEPTKMRSPSTA